VLRGKVGVIEPLLEDGLAVAVLAGERRRMISVDGESPDLKFLGSQHLLRPLSKGNLVKKPIGPARSATYFAASVQSTSR